MTKEAKAAYDKQYRQKNLLKRRLQNLQWQNKNKERHNAHNKKYRQNNKGTVNSFTAKRHASKLQRTPKWLTKEQKNDIKFYYQAAKYFSNLFNQKMDVDHIVPLRGKNVSGLHVPWNLQLMVHKANIEKNNRYE